MNLSKLMIYYRISKLIKALYWVREIVMKKFTWL